MALATPLQKTTARVLGRAKVKIAAMARVRPRGVMRSGERGQLGRPRESDCEGAALTAPLRRVCGAVCVMTVCQECTGFVCSVRCLCRQSNVSGMEADGKRMVPGKAPEQKAGAQPWLHRRAHLVAADRVKRFGPAKERGKEKLRTPVSTREQKMMDREQSQVASSGTRQDASG